MRLNAGLHLAYCTNVHRGESWADTFGALERHTLEVRRRVAPGLAYGLGLRLGHRAAEELVQKDALAAFRRWLQRHDIYVFTINGFPYGDFHGTRVKEQVYAPDWSTPERLAYTNRLFDLLAQLLPEGVAGSVSTVPGSFKAFMGEPARERAIFANLAACARHIEKCAAESGRDLHLGLEPEPLCLIETSWETVAFFDRWRTAEPEAERLLSRVGVNYDCCHLAVEFESPAEALDRLAAAGLRLSKLHLSSALRVRPDAAGRQALAAFVEPTYLHQVVAGRPGAVRRRFADLPDALADPAPAPPDEEWRVHFHVPLHAAPSAPFLDTRDHLLGALDWLRDHPGACEHLEMETYTWEVLPPDLRLAAVEDQIVREYGWTLEACGRRGLADPALAERAAGPSSLAERELRRGKFPSGASRGQKFRKWLDLARAGNFPSVWSNVLAAFVLSSPPGTRWPPGRLWALATAGATLAYAGGTTWNDVCDAAFDARHRPERPIPSGSVSRAKAAWVGAAELAAGLALFRAAGASLALFAGLAGAILLYDLAHKRWAASVLLMAGCRSLLALVVASLPGHADRPALLLWMAALFVYIVALSLLARREYRPGAPAPKLGRIVGRLLAFIPFVDTAALVGTGAFFPAAACAAAVPLGRWAQRRAAST